MIKWRENPEMVAYMKEIIPGHEESEIRAMFLEKFSIELSESQIGNFKNKYKIYSGTHGGCFKKGQIPMNKGKKMSPEVYERVKHSMFHKGHTPVNHRPVGSERINVDGYTEIKVAEPNKWRLKQRVIYEEHYGVELTKNDAIVFLDGNKQNFDIDNLFRLSRAALVRYNQDGFYSNDPEQSRAAAQVATLKTKIRKAKNGTDR